MAIKNQPGNSNGISQRKNIAMGGHVKGVSGKSGPMSPISKPVSTKPSDTKMAQDKSKASIKPVAPPPSVPAIKAKTVGTGKSVSTRKPNIAMY